MTEGFRQQAHLNELYSLKAKTYNVRCTTLQELPPVSAGHRRWPWTESMLVAAPRFIDKANCLSAATKQEIMAELQAHRETYPKKLWKQSERLARIGLPSSIVEPIRKLRVTVEETIRDGLKAL